MCPVLIAHGAVGGLISGAVVMTWFFVMDVVAGQPLATPTLLASALLDRQVVDANLGILPVVALNLIGVTPGLVVVGNLLAVGAMGRWIWVTHPRLRQRLVERPVATMV